MSRARGLLPLVTTLAIVAVSGCGGGGSEPVTAAELVKRADAICGQERSTFANIQAHPPPNASIAADQTDELIKATQDANSRLRDLEPPEQLQAAYERYLKARDTAVDQMKRGRDAAQDRNTATYGAAQAAVARDAPQRRQLARALGLKVCSSDRGAS